MMHPESFGHSVFKDSFKRVFEKGEESLGLAHNGTLDITCSKDIKIQGIIGPCTSLDKKGPTLYIQTTTRYESVDGQPKLRVTTITRRWVESVVVSEELMQVFVTFQFFCTHGTTQAFNNSKSHTTTIKNPWQEVVSIKAVGIAIELILEGINQISYPQTWVFVTVAVLCVITQLSYLNKAFDTFNTTIVSPIYYVIFTSLTIIASMNGCVTQAFKSTEEDRHLAINLEKKEQWEDADYLKLIKLTWGELGITQKMHDALYMDVCFSNR
ncbi:unnamed protein product [Lactuca virosa]|uniref:Probable magnesium transporter n=1 Tax=Lactuca virosa TaxID=75947 RepID=A0AAU9MR92_9ASTR|nr:unnamed protein product [Lactuca virosa]